MSRETDPTTPTVTLTSTPPSAAQTGASQPPASDPAAAPPERHSPAPPSGRLSVADAPTATGAARQAARRPIIRPAAPEPEPSFDDYARVCDLRRRTHPRLVERLLSRAEYLPATERALIHAVYAEGRSIAECAALSREPASTVRARVRRVVRRMAAPEFAFVAIYRDSWPPDLRRTGTLHFLHGLNMRRISLQLGWPFHTVRRQREAILALFEADRDAAARASPASPTVRKSA